jgi:molybdopterin converting factor small subunit
MSVKVEFMGILAERAGRSADLFDSQGTKNDLLQALLEKYPVFRGINFVISVNGVIRHGKTTIGDGDCITLIPPAPGG